MYFRNGLIYIADIRNRKIVVFKTDGTVAFVIDRFGHGEGGISGLRVFHGG